MSVSHGCEIVHIIQDLVLMIHSKDYVQQIGQFFHFHAFFLEKNWQYRMLAPVLEGWNPDLREIMDPPLKLALLEAKH